MNTMTYVKLQLGLLDFRVASQTHRSQYYNETLFIMACTHKAAKHIDYYFRGKTNILVCCIQIR